MKTYLATFYTDAHYAEHPVKAANPEQALKQARGLADDPNWLPDFESYDGAGDINHIEIRTSTMTTVAEWQDDDLRLRLAAGDLLDALRQAVQALNEAPRFPVPGLLTDSYRIAAICDRAIAKAKGDAP